MYDIAIEILNIINDNGYEAYIIGGYPRDLYLGFNNPDIDICTNITYENLKNLLSGYEIINQNFGSMVLKYKGFEFEITTYRKEFEYEKIDILKK